MTVKELKEKLSINEDTAWSKRDRSEVDAFTKDYMDFLPKAKTERVASREIVRQLKEAGFSDLNDAEKVSKGDKVYLHLKEKIVVAFVVGDEKLRIVGSHLDSPRLDVKPLPMSEGGGLALLKTHYYGGVKKYQWTNVDLALYGVIHDKGGKKIEFNLGEADDDPRFLVSDLLPHLAQKQMEKSGSEIVQAEQLQVYAGSVPYPLEGEDASAKLALLKLINERYGLIEEDFSYAELTLVPAGDPREIGFDKSLIAGYAHDDKVCAYTSLRALLDVEDPEHTACCLWVDKEEIGSDGDTGAQSFTLYHAVSRLLCAMGSEADAWAVLNDAQALSADVTAAFDPNHTDVFDKESASFIGRGVVLEKFTGSRGKYSANDASAEFLNEIRGIFADDVVFQVSGGLGKVDLGGGGTIAKFLSRYGMQTVDCGPAVLGMHAPREIVSKIDAYEAYRAYRAFLR